MAVVRTPARSKLSRPAIGTTPLMSLILVLLLSTACFPESDLDYELGAVTFAADYDCVFLPGKINALIFDTTACMTSTDSQPSWRFIGPLKVVALELAGEPTELRDSSQLAGVRIDCPQLLHCMNRYKASALKRRIPKAEPFDTLKWNRVRKQYVVVPDMSKHFRINFAPDLPVDSMIACLETASGIGGLNKAYIPQIDPWPDLTGDVNLNGILMELADVELLSKYFLQGSAVFHISSEAQIAFSLVARDSIRDTPTVKDLVYMIRSITGDALPPQELPADRDYADTVRVELDEPSLSIESPTRIAAIWMSLVGADSTEVANLTPLTLGLSMHTDTMIMLLSPGLDSLSSHVPIGAAQILHVPNASRIVGFQAATYDGALLQGVLKTDSGWVELPDNRAR